MRFLDESCLSGYCFLTVLEHPGERTVGFSERFVLGFVSFPHAQIALIGYISRIKLRYFSLRLLKLLALRGCELSSLCSFHNGRSIVVFFIRRSLL